MEVRKKQRVKEEEERRKEKCIGSVAKEGRKRKTRRNGEIKPLFVGRSTTVATSWALGNLRERSSQISALLRGSLPPYIPRTAVLFAERRRADLVRRRSVITEKIVHSSFCECDYRQSSRRENSSRNIEERSKRHVDWVKRINGGECESFMKVNPCRVEYVE